jgi:hypothetical protein
VDAAVAVRSTGQRQPRGTAVQSFEDILKAAWRPGGCVRLFSPYNGRMGATQADEACDATKNQPGGPQAELLAPRK